MTQGFRIGFCRSLGRLCSLSANHPSSLANNSVVEKYICSEVALGRLMDPITGEAVAGIHISPISLVPKAHRVNAWRMIVDLSSPHGQSVNDGISSELSSVQYASIDEAVSVMLSMGQATLLVKIDLKDAYHLVLVHPEDHHLLGISWGGAVYVDRCPHLGSDRCQRFSQPFLTHWLGLFSATGQTFAPAGSHYGPVRGHVAGRSWSRLLDICHMRPLWSGKVTPSFANYLQS